MRSRFAQVEQIGEELAHQSLRSLADQVDTQTHAPHGASAALVVFNSIGAPARQRLETEFDLPAGLAQFEIVDSDGQPVAYRLLRRFDKNLADMDLDADGLRGMLSMVQDGRVLGLTVEAVAVVPRPGGGLIDVVLGENAVPNPSALVAAGHQIDDLLADPSRTTFRLLVRLASRARIEWAPPQTPAHGLRTWWLRPGPQDSLGTRTDAGRRIENESLIVEVEAEGTLRLTDKRSQRMVSGLLRFSDRGDRGNSYTFCPLSDDPPVEAPAGPPEIECLHEATGDTLIIRREFRLPQRLADDRLQRSEETCALPVRVCARLTPDVPRLDLEIEVDNPAEDHRLQVLFPGGRPSSEALSDGAFEIIARATAPRSGAAEWAEQPVPEFPMRAFVADRRYRRSDGLYSRPSGGFGLSRRGDRRDAAALLWLAVAR